MAQISKKEILESFKQAEVFKEFKKLSEDKRNEIIGEIMSIKSAEKQIKLIVKTIEQFGKNLD